MKTKDHFILAFFYLKIYQGLPIKTGFTLDLHPLKVVTLFASSRNGHLFSSKIFDLKPIFEVPLSRPKGFVQPHASTHNLK